MWCWKRMEKISWTDRARNEEVLQRVPGQEYPENYNKEECYQDWSHLAQEVPFTTRHWSKDRRKGIWREDEDEDIRSYWMNVRKWEDTGYWKRKHWLAPCGEFGLDKAVDLPQSRLRDDNDDDNVILVGIQSLNLLKPTGYVMHQEFNIQQLYVLPTLYLCVLYLSENKQRLVPLTA